MNNRLLLHIGLSLVATSFFIGSLEMGSRLLHVYKKRSNDFEILIDEQGIKRHKDKDEKRVFIVGESAARGVPYSIEYSVSGLLQELMNRSGNKHVRVINTGVPGKHSFYHREEDQTLIFYQANAVIIYAGNNDTRDFSYVIRDVPFASLDFKLTWTSFFYAYLKIKMVGLKDEINKITKRKIFEINRNQDDILHWTDTYLKKKKSYWENPALGRQRKDQALVDFENNLDVLVKHLEQKNIEVHITNLPIVHESLPGIADWSRKGYDFEHKIMFKNKEDKFEWNESYKQGEALLNEKKYNLALANFQTAFKIDSSYPLLLHKMAIVHHHMENFAKAKELYTQAKDLQIQSPGGDSYKNAALKRIADRNQTHWIDLQDVLEKNSTNGILGPELFLDFCHANLLGNKIMAARMMESLCHSNFVSCPKEQNWNDWLKFLIGGEINPKNVAREYLLIAFYKFKGTAWEPSPHYDEAILYLEKARQITPENKNLYPFLAASYWQIGDKDNAYKNLKILHNLDQKEYQKTLKDFSYLAELKTA